MFSLCKNLIKLDLSNINISNVADLSHMFDGCSNMEILDLSSLTIGDKNKINDMFKEMTKIQEIKVNKNAFENFKKNFKNIESKFRIN